MDQGKTGAEKAPPHLQLIEMARAHWLSRIAYVAAELGLADHIHAGQHSVDDLAKVTGTHAPSLYRFLRTLAGLGLFREAPPRHFTLTPVGEALRKGAPGAARATILTMASDLWVRGFKELRYSLETGKSGFEKIMGMPVFDWLGEHPEEAALFSETMIGVHGQEPAAVAASYDFSRFDTIIDVGGATGHLLTTILGQHKSPKGVLFDLPHVVREAPALIAACGLTDRVSIAKGSFFETIPEGGDVYLMSHIIHDWSDEQCLTILANFHKVLRKDARLLLIETVLPDDNSFHPGLILDIVMLVAPGGQERTRSGYRDLLAKAEFEMTNVIATPSPVSIVEAMPR